VATLGSAWITVEPAGEQTFGPEAKKLVDTATRGMNAPIPVTPDGRAFRADTARAVDAGIRGLKGTVPVAADTTPLKRDLAAAQAALDAASRKAYQFRMTADPAAVQQAVAAARTRLEQATARVYQFKIGADDKEAELAITKAKAELGALDRRLARPKIQLDGVDRALAGILSVDLALDKLDAKSAKPDVDTKTLIPSLTQLGTTLGNASSGFVALVGAAVVLSPVLLTVGAALAGFGAAAAEVIGPILKAGTATDAQRKALMGLDENQRNAYGSLAALKDELGKFGKDLEPAVLDVFNSGLKLAKDLMGDLIGVGSGAGHAIAGMLDTIDAEFRSGNWNKFFFFMHDQAAPDIKLLTDLFVQLLEVLPPLVMALQPMAEALLKDTTQIAELIGWLEKFPGAIDSAETAIRSHTGQTQEAAKAHSVFGDALKRTTVQLLNGIVPGLGTALPFLQKYADSTDKSGTSTGKMGDSFRNAVDPAKAYTDQVQRAADATKNLMDRQSAALDKQTAYGNSMVISANDAAALRDRLNESAGKVGLHTQKERDSFSAANTYIASLEDQAKQAIASGHGEDVAATAIRNGLPLLDSAKTKNKQYWQEVKTLTGWLHQLDQIKAINEAIHVNATGQWSVTPGKIGLPGGTAGGPFARGGLVAQAGLYVAAGTTPTADDVLIRASKGELVVPANMVSAGAVDHLRGAIPGFAAGGVTGSYGPGRVAGIPPWGNAELNATERAVARSTAKSMADAINQAKTQAANPFAGITGVPSGGAIGPGAASAQAFARSILWAYGWGPEQMPSLIALWNGESGWNYRAYNASSGATGIPQSLPASKMASAGADYLTNPATQIRWGLGYIKQVYGSPAAAYSRWLGRSPHWYADGGLVGVAEGLIPAMAAGGAVPAGGTSTQAGLRFWLGAAQYGERRDYLGLAHAFAAGPARYRTATVRAELATLAHRQAAEQAAYAHLAGSGLTQANMAKLGAAAKAEESTARDKALSHLPGGHPGWVSGLEHYLGQLVTLSAKKVPPPPQTIWTRDPDLSALLAAARAESTAFWKLAGDKLPKTATRAQHADLAAWDRVLGRQQVHTFGFGKGGLFQQLMDSFHNRRVPPWAAFGSAVDYLTREVEGTGIRGGINPPGTPHQSGWVPWHYFHKDWQSLLTALRTVKSKLAGAAPWHPGSLGASHTAPDGVLTFDRGGTLPPGLSLSYNGLGRPEHLTPDSGGGGITVNLNLTVTGPVGSQAELERWFVQMANRMARTGSLSQAIRTGM